jgi:hypothetical protein
MTTAVQRSVVTASLLFVCLPAVYAEPVGYETDAQGRVIFIRNLAAREAREAAAAAGLVVRSLPELGAEAVRAVAGRPGVTVRDPDQAQLEESVSGLQAADEPQAASPGAAASQAAGPDFWQQRDRQSLIEHSSVVQIADAFLAVHGQVFGRPRPSRAYTRTPADWKRTVTPNVANQMLEDGCTMSDEIAKAAAAASNHGGFVSAVAELTNNWKKAGLISGADKGNIQNCAARRQSWRQN